MEDNKILMLYRNRSEDAILESRKKYENYCYKIAKSILSSHEDAEECVNDAFVKAWQSIPPHSPTSLSAFLGAITRNLAINRLEASLAAKRNAKILPLIEELGESLSDAVWQEDVVDEIVLREALNAFLSSLPTLARRIFLQRYWYCQSTREIATAFGMTEGNVRVLLYRARKDLKRFLIKEGILV